MNLAPPGGVEVVFLLCSTGTFPNQLSIEEEGCIGGAEHAGEQTLTPPYLRISHPVFVDSEAYLNLMN